MAPTRELVAPRARDPVANSLQRVNAATAALGFIMLGAAALLLYAGRHLTFFFDEWDFVLGRRGTGVGTFLDPHNGHPALFGVVVYKVLFALVGLRHYTPYQAVLVALNLLCGGLLYVLARRRLGDWLALVPAALLMFMGTAFQDLLWPFQMGFLASVAGGLGALALLELRRIRADAAATALLVWSLTASAVGVPFLLASAALLIAQRHPQRLWVVIAPAVLFVTWYIGWGTGEHITSDSVLGAPQYVADAASGAMAGIAGLSISWGPPLAVAGLVAVALSWTRPHHLPPTPILLAAALGALTFWGLSAIARADFADPGASRYLYVGAVFVMLIAVETGAGKSVRGFSIGLGAILLLGALIANLAALRAGERQLRASDDSVRSSLTAVQIAAPIVSPALQPDPVNAPQITAGPYLAAVRELGSPALTLHELERAPGSIRLHADAVIVEAERLSAQPTRGTIAGTARPVVEAVFGAHLATPGVCAVIVPTTPLGSVDLRFEPGRTVFVHSAAGSSVEIYLRRLAPTFSGAPFAVTPPGTAARIRFPTDGAMQLPWHVQLVGAHRFTACSA